MNDFVKERKNIIHVKAIYFEILDNTAGKN